MTPGERSWLERMVAQWGGMAAQTRRIACTRESALSRAAALEEIVGRLQARLDASTLVMPVSIARRHHLTEMAAYRDQRAAGAATTPARLRRNIFAEMAAEARPGGQAPTIVTVAASIPRLAMPDLPMIPPPVAAPFVAGPQMSFAL